MCVDKNPTKEDRATTTSSMEVEKKRVEKLVVVVSCLLCFESFWEGCTSSFNNAGL